VRAAAAALPAATRSRHAPATAAAAALPGVPRLAAALLAGLLALLTGCAGLPEGPQPAAEPTLAAAPPPPAPTPAASAASAAEAPVAVLPPSSAQVWRNHERARLPVDPSRNDLWVRVREGLALEPLKDPLVTKWEQYYASRPDYMARMADRARLYLFSIVEEVDARELPMELALLPFIESAFNPQAVSSARAAGMWQFVAATGRDFELTQNLFRDDRRDVLASTRAALDYLQQLYAQFGDWHLALAAYNWGPGSVQRAQRVNRARHREVDYASLKMPAETRNYVPKLQAVVNLIREPEAYGLSLPAVANHPHFLGVAIERDIDVSLAAQLAGMPEAEFLQFNPQVNPPVILAAGTPQLLLPYDNANQFLKSLAEHTGPLARWTAWVAPKTLTVPEAARMTGMREDELREVNRIPPRVRVRAGSTLDPLAGDDVGAELADNAAILLAPDAPALRRVVLKVGKNGDSVAAVAKRLRLSRQDVARWNRVSTTARFKPGTHVVVMLPLKPAAKTRVAKKKPPAATVSTAVVKPVGTDNGKAKATSSSKAAATKKSPPVAKSKAKS